MQITFDPFDDVEVNTVHKIMAVVSGVAEATGTIPGNLETITVDATTPVSGVTAAPEPPATAATSATGETDVHGMTWNEAIHSAPPAKNNDGSWRARRNHKKEYEAAIAAHKATQVAMGGQAMVPDQQPAGMTTGAGGTVSMPTIPAMPAAPAPQTPPEPISYEEMARRFAGMMESEVITDYEAVYRDLDIDYTQLETNQTMIGRLWQYMDAVGEGVAHRSAIGMVMPNATG